MTKPTENLTWTATGNKTDPAAIGTDGYKTTDLVPSKFLNYQLAIITEWQQFVDRAFGKTYYVEQASGDDGNDGSATYPFKTIKFACDTVEAGGYGNVVMAESGTYPVAADIDLYNKNIYITASGATRDISFSSYTDTGENNLYGFNLYYNSNLAINARNITIAAPDDTGNDWNEYASCIKVIKGTSSVILNATGNLRVTNIAATGTNLPAFVYPVTRSGVSLYVKATSSITTNNKGCVLQLDNTASAILTHGGGTIDNPLLWLDGGITKRHTIRAESDTVLTTALNPVTPNVTITLKIVRGDNISGAVDMLGSEDTATLTYTDDETTSMLPAIKALFSSAYPDINTDDISITPVIISGIGFAGFTITITDDSKNINFDVISVDSVFGGYLKESTGRDAIYYEHKNINLLTNITSLK